jgi:phage-related protein
MGWRVITLNAKVEEEIIQLPDDLQAKFFRIVNLIKEHGLEKVREPYVKPLEIKARKKLWEMRMKGKSGIARAIYVTVVDRKVVVLHAFIKKTEKTPRQAIEKALKRLEELET